MRMRRTIEGTVIAVVSSLFILTTGSPATGQPGSAAELRLVPSPKKITLASGQIDLRGKWVFEIPVGLPIIGQLVAEEMARAGLTPPEVKSLPGDSAILQFRLTRPGTVAEPPQLPEFRSGATSEDYVLCVNPQEIVGLAPGDSGLLYAAMTLCQLLRANRGESGSLPCLLIEDWPVLRWRCFQDDLTRGPSTKLESLERSLALGAFFKYNLWTYYMEYQFAFSKHPEIGPADGSLTPAELQALVKIGRRFGMEIIGNQQSFGHFQWILRHEKFAHLREKPHLLTPVREETYQLLDELYSEVCPLLPFEMFNVCCDETRGLGEGPSKELAQKIGVGGVYVEHILRVRALLREKYGKRMMMWGDIILQHPDHLEKIPRDVVMLTWNYSPLDSFDRLIVPFQKAGFEFFVCPGIHNWSRILPDFGVAMKNIRNFVRDGVQYGASGMINTDWEDDGEALQGYRWHGHAWGAECAWNGGTTEPEDFQRRIGAVLFGERGEHFGKAITLLAETHRLPGAEGMGNRRFWRQDFVPSAPESEVRGFAERLLSLVRPAIEHLEACRKEATANADLLESFLHGAKRMELIAQRMLDGLEAVALYKEALTGDPGDAVAAIEKVENLVRRNRDAHQALGEKFAQLWLADCKPYALDWTMKRYEATIAWYDGVLTRLAEAKRAAKGRQPLPSLEVSRIASL